jgi:putative endonuclease
MEKPNKKAKCGKRGERLASLWLKLHGYRILHRNYRIVHKELDIIAENKEYIVFVEVKTHSSRKDGSFGRPANAVNYEKQQNTISAVRSYLRYNPSEKQPRIDVIEVWLGKPFPKINHIKNAIRR